MGRGRKGERKKGDEGTEVKARREKKSERRGIGGNRRDVKRGSRKRRNHLTVERHRRERILRDTQE